jgi:hypothetical protein
MGSGEDAWHLCAEHEDQVIEDAKRLANSFDEDDPEK